MKTIHIQAKRILATGVSGSTTNGITQNIKGIYCGFSGCGLGGTKIIVAANTINGRIIPMMTVVASSVLHSRNDVTSLGTLRNPGLNFTKRDKSMPAVTSATRGGAHCSTAVCRPAPSGMGFNDTVISPSPNQSKVHASAKANSPRKMMSRTLIFKDKDMTPAVRTYRSWIRLSLDNREPSEC